VRNEIAPVCPTGRGERRPDNLEIFGAIGIGADDQRRAAVEVRMVARQRRQPHSTPQMPWQAPTQSGHFSESEIDHFVMAITSAEAMVRHTTLIGRLK
jgi:hypothetical protein